VWGECWKVVGEPWGGGGGGGLKPCKLIGINGTNHPPPPLKKAALT